MGPEAAEPPDTSSAQKRVCFMRHRHSNAPVVINSRLIQGETGCRTDLLKWASEFRSRQGLSGFAQVGADAAGDL